MKSIDAMIKQLRAMVGTDDLTDWETSFVESVAERAAMHVPLSSKQVEIIDRLYTKHFADG